MIRLVCRVECGEGDASRWLPAFNAAYSRKAGMPLFPGSLNLALGATFDWFVPEIARRTIHFDHAEYSGERDILLATAARDRSDPWVIEVIAAKPLRQSFHLVDGSSVIVELPDPPYGTDQGTKMMP